MPADTITLANMLRSCGYKTGAFGKWGLGAQNSHSSPMAMGFDLFFGYNCQYLAHNYYPDHLWQNSKKNSSQRQLRREQNAIFSRHHTLPIDKFYKDMLLTTQTRQKAVFYILRNDSSARGNGSTPRCT